MSLDVDETYQLRIGATSDDQVNATIIGRTFFGIRHGLETLSQLVIYDDIRDLVLVCGEQLHTYILLKLVLLFFGSSA